MPLDDMDDTVDEIEEVETEKSSPYHLIGALCFLTSIVTGIFTVSLSAVFQDEWEYLTVRAVYFTLFLAFLAFLFLCLCCTYYLGASREAWEAPSFEKIHWNGPSIIALTGIILEFIQISSFSWNENYPYLGSKFLIYTQYLARPYEEGEYFTTSYWIMFVVAFSPYIFVIVIRIVIYIYGVRNGEEKVAIIVEKYQENIYSVLWVLVNTLYLPVIVTMIAGVDCTFTETAITLDSQPNVNCLVDGHVAMLVCSMIALIIYYPSASFAQSQTHNISDIKFKPKIVFVMLQGKFVLAGFVTAFTTIGAVYYSSVIVINIFFLGMNLYYQPCILGWVNRLRTAFFSFSLWGIIVGAIGAILHDQDNQSNSLPLILLLIGWATLLIGFITFFSVFAQKKVADKNSA